MNYISANQWQISRYLSLQTKICLIAICEPHTENFAGILIRVQSLNLFHAEYC